MRFTIIVNIGCDPLYGPNFQNAIVGIKFRKAKRHYCKFANKLLPTRELEVLDVLLDNIFHQSRHWHCPLVRDRLIRPTIVNRKDVVNRVYNLEGFT